MLKNRVERLEAKTIVTTASKNGLNYDALKIFYCNPELHKLHGNSCREEADIVLVGIDDK